MLGMAGYLWAGLWNRELTWYYLLSLPVAIPVIWLWAARQIDGGPWNFFKYVYSELIVIGFPLLLQTGLHETG